MRQSLWCLILLAIIVLQLSAETPIRNVGKIYLGQSLANVRKIYPKCAYSGVEKNFSGHYWICSRDLGVVAQSDTVQALILRSDRYSAHGVSVGYSLVKVEALIGVGDQLEVGGHAIRPTVIDYKDECMRIWVDNGIVTRILLTAAPSSLGF